MDLVAIHLADALPDLATEIVRSLQEDGRDYLAEQVPTLPIGAPCGCGDDFCSSFYTGPKPDGAWGPGHRNVEIESDKAMIILDVVDDVIRFVEVLWWPEIGETLKSLIRS